MTSAEEMLQKIEDGQLQKGWAENITKRIIWGEEKELSKEYTPEL